MSATERRFTALILAGSRGPDDPVARQAGQTHKALVPVAGVPMVALWRVPFASPEGLPDRPLRNGRPRCFLAAFSASVIAHSAAIGRNVVTPL